MSATQQTLAQLIRSKHPGAYDDMDDATLEKNVLAKYPQYSDIPRTQSAPNLKTGEGMEAQAQQQAKRVFTGTGSQGFYNTRGQKVSGPSGEPLTLMEKAAQNQDAQQTKLQTRLNRASNAPTPVTTASSALIPVAAMGAKAALPFLARTTLGGAAGAGLGGYGGREIGGLFGPQYAETGGRIGSLVGGLTGGYTAARGGEVPGRSNFLSKILGMGETPPEVFPVSKSPGPYRGPSSVPKPPPPAAPEVFPVSKSPGPYRGPSFLAKQQAAARATEPLVKTPEEFAAEDSLQKIAEQRAKQRGMQYAGGVRTAGANKKSNQLFPLPWMRDE